MWIGFAYDKKKRTSDIMVAACSDSHKRCSRIVKRRFPGRPTLCLWFGPESIAEEIGRKMSNWLIEHGMSSEDAASAVRLFGHSMTVVLTDIKESDQ